MKAWTDIKHEKNVSRLHYKYWMRWFVTTACPQTLSLSSLSHSVELLTSRSFVNPAGRWGHTCIHTQTFLSSESCDVKGLVDNHFPVILSVLFFYLAAFCIFSWWGKCWGLTSATVPFTPCAALWRRGIVPGKSIFSIFLSGWSVVSLCVSLTTSNLHQVVHGGRAIVERSCIFCWNGTVGRTQTPCPQKHTYTCSALFLQGIAQTCIILHQACAHKIWCRSVCYLG